jgi:hypothetical protein
MERVSAYLEKQSEPISRNKIVEGVRGKREYTLKAITCLLEAGCATENEKLVSFAQRFPVPDQFPPVPGTTPDTPVPGSPPPTRGNRNGNRSDEVDDAEVERLVSKYGNGSAAKSEFPF